MSVFIRKFFTKNTRKIKATLLLIAFMLGGLSSAFASQLTYLDYDSGKSAPYDDELSYTLSETQSTISSGQINPGGSVVIDTWYGDPDEASGNSYSTNSTWTFYLYLHYTQGGSGKNPIPTIDITVGDTTNGDYFTTPQQGGLTQTTPTLVTINYTDSSGRTLPVGARLYVKITGHNTSSSGKWCNITVTLGTSTYNSRVDSPFPYKIPTLGPYLLAVLLTFVIVYLLKVGVLQFAPNGWVFSLSSNQMSRNWLEIRRFVKKRVRRCRSNGED